MIKYLKIKYAVIFLLMILTAQLSAEDKSEQIEKNYILGQIINDLNLVFDLFENTANEIIPQLNITEIDSSQNLALLEKIKNIDKDAVFNVCLIDLAGNIKNVFPTEFNDIIGKNVSKQTHFIKLKDTEKPVVSDIINTVEGIPAIILQYPLFDKKQKLAGALSIMLKHNHFIGKICAPLLKGLPVEVFFMQIDGTVLYDEDGSEIGLNVFTDELYLTFTDLRKSMESVVSKRIGASQYSFFSKGMDKDVDKSIYWNTFDKYDNKWRIVLAHTSDDYNLFQRQLSELEELRIMEELYEFADDINKKNILLNNSEEEGLQELKKIYKEIYGIYSVQWIDKKGVNKYGYTPENSLLNFDYYSRKDKNEFIKRFEVREACVFTQILMEGNTAKFFMQPLFVDNEFEGFVYIMILQ